MKHPHKIDRSQYTTKKEEIQTSNSNKRKTMSSPETEFHEPAQVVIAGAGIVGLVLALALKKHVGITAELYEKAHVFHDDVGAALGFYPNGMRVLRDIDPELLYAIKEKGFPFVYRRWERHDGTEIAEAKESVLSEGDEELDSVGIRRWRLQKVLYEHVLAAGIPVHFCKATSDVVERKDGLVEVSFEDGTTRLTRILFGVDGGKSTVRQKVADPSVQLRYTGITCLMGMSNIPSQRLGINFPCSTSTNCHSVYFPTGKEEQCFQIHWPLEEEEADQGNWGNLDNALGQEECRKLAARLRADGWHERYCEPLDHVTHAVKVGFCLLEPRLSQWVYGTRGQVVLVGDAAHPPVPYLGQGAQMGVEDAGTIALLMKNLCLTRNGEFDITNFSKAMHIYERIRVPRTSMILDCSKELGGMQDERADANKAEMQELYLQGEILMDETLSIMLPGATFNYVEDVEREMQNEKAKQEDKSDLDCLLLQGEFLFNEAVLVSTE